MKPVYIVSSLLITFLIVGGWFYWFQWRSSNIRKECVKNAIEESIRVYPAYKTGRTTYEPDTAKRTVLQQELQALEIDNCLNEKGLQ